MIVCSSICVRSLSILNLHRRTLQNISENFNVHVTFCKNCTKKVQAKQKRTLMNFWKCFWDFFHKSTIVKNLWINTFRIKMSKFATLIFKNQRKNQIYWVKQWWIFCFLAAKYITLEISWMNTTYSKKEKNM